MVELDTEQLDKILDPKVVLKTVPEVVFIDEATQVDALTLQVLNYLADKYDFKVILAGDTTQRGLTSFGDTQAIKDLFMYKSPKLSLSIRALNN
jgi:thymidine kinase